MKWPLLVLLLISTASAAEGKKDAITITAVAPLAISPGKATVTLVGVKVDEATAVLVGDAVGATPSTQPATAPSSQPTAHIPLAQIKGRGKVTVPKGAEAAQVGDASVDIELTVPDDTPDGELPLVLTAPSGRSAVVRLLVKRAGEMMDEKEPNNGFRDAQPIEPGKWVRGAISSPGDVDVFRLAGKSGQMLVAEVLAHRRHSLLDSLLVLYDDHGNVLAENDDFNDADSLIRFTLPSDGTYFLSITDANDRGNPGFPYLLAIKFEPR